MTDEFDDVIDPELMEAALDEAMNKPVEDCVTILELLNGAKIKLRYRPKGIAHMMEAAQGTPTRQKSSRFDYARWSKEVLPKLNSAILNTQIVDDLGGKPIEKGKIRFSLIPAGEYYRLYDACFPGYSDDPKDSRDKDNANSGKTGKGVRRVASSESSG